VSTGHGFPDDHPAMTEPATADPGRGGHRRIHLTGRHPRHTATLSLAAHRVALSITAFIGIVALGVLADIAVAVALLIGNVFRRAGWPYQATLGRAPGCPDSTT
jgi:hypothetical protein